MKNKMSLSLLVKLGIASTLATGVVVADPKPPQIQHNLEYDIMDQDKDKKVSFKEYTTYIGEQQAYEYQKQFKTMYLSSSKDSNAINIDEFIAKAPFSTKQNDDLFIAYSGKDALMDSEEFAAMRLLEEGSNDALWYFTTKDSNMDGSISLEEWESLPIVKPEPGKPGTALSETQKAQLGLIQSVVATKRKIGRINKVITKLQAKLEDTESEAKQERLAKKIKRKEAQAKRLDNKLAQLHNKLSNVSDADVKAIVNNQEMVLLELEEKLAQAKGKKAIRSLKRKINQVKQTIQETLDLKNIGIQPIVDPTKPPVEPINPPSTDSSFPFEVTDTEIKANQEKWEAFKREYNSKGFGYTIREGKVVTSTIFKQNNVIVDAETKVYPNGLMPDQALTIDSLFSKLKGKAVKFDEKYGYPVTIDWPLPPPVATTATNSTNGALSDEKMVEMVIKPASPDGVQTFTVSNFKVGIEDSGLVKLSKLKQELKKALLSKDGYHYTLTPSWEWYMNEQPKSIVVNVKDAKVVSAFTSNSPHSEVKDTSHLSSIETMLNTIQKDLMNHKLSVNFGGDGQGTGFKVSTYMQDMNLSDPSGSSYAIEKIGLMNIWFSEKVDTTTEVAHTSEEKVF